MLNCLCGLGHGSRVETSLGCGVLILVAERPKIPQRSCNDSMLATCEAKEAARCLENAAPKHTEGPKGLEGLGT